MQITIDENGLYGVIAITDDGDVRFHGLSNHPIHSLNEEESRWQRLVEIQESGYNQNDHHGNKHTGTQPGQLLRYVTHQNIQNSFGRKLEIIQAHDNLYVTSHIQLFNDLPVIQSWTTLKNKGNHPRKIEYISSFALTGLSMTSPLARDRDAIVHIPHNTWYGESQWQSYSLHECGYHIVNDFSMKRLAYSSTGSWPSSEYLPMGAYENPASQSCILWSIETAASWNWELSDIDRQLYLLISGPSFTENHFYKALQAGETFESVKCSVAFTKDFTTGIQQMTQYRRRIRRPNQDNEHPSVIFNDYMNCLDGNPTAEKSYPLIDAAAKVGCKYYCIDCGWYDDGFWWDGVGEWLPSQVRFPDGIESVLEYIHQKGMISGLWLELEVVGIQSPLAKALPEECFFQRNGERVIDHGRYQLDFRHPKTIEHANNIIARLVEQYGVGYIKMDYNINAGVGTEIRSDSFGDGLLAHTRAYLDWLDTIFIKYPDLVIENCGSGGMRTEYSLLQRHSIHSVTDQTDYIKMAAIACNCATAVTPEQAAIWSYPLQNGDNEEVIFNMVNALLLRIHQSGHLAELSKERLTFVEEGIAVHKQIIDEIKYGLPFWPIGLASFSSPFISFGIETNEKLYIAVWCCFGEGGTIQLPIEQARNRLANVRCLYPNAENIITAFQWNTQDSYLSVTLAPKTARIFEITLI